ncbi:hypothetical protein A7K73_01330 [Candidatus Methylacidiphilum fumarolicum]|nr:hypothetical protein A7K73_01330 [Candidatus Methylacidiphilum fumarolicum]
MPTLLHIFASFFSGRMNNIKAVAKSLVVWPWEYKEMPLGSLKDLVVCSTVLSLWRGKGSELGRTFTSERRESPYF